MPPYTLIARSNDLGRVAEKAAAAQIIGLDIECYRPSGGPETDPRKGLIRLLQLNLDGATFIVDLMRLDHDLGPVLAALKQTRGIYVIHNAKFEQKWLLHHYELELWPLFCTFRASALIYNGNQLAHKLDNVIERELGETVEVTGEGASDWSRPNLSSRQLDYAAEDVQRLPQLRSALREKLKRQGLLQTALIEFGACLSEASIELKGFPVDQVQWRAVERENSATAKRLKEELIYELPHPRDQLALPGMSGGWNIDSSQQMLASLRKLNLKSKVEGKTVPLPNTSSLTLAPHALKLPVIKKILDYRHAKQRVKTFGLDWLKWVDPEDQRIHAEFYGLLVSGRYACCVGSTQVRCFTGSKRMDEVRAGDYVWTHKERWRKVKRWWLTGVRQTYVVRFSNGNVLRCTGDHRLLSSDREWITVESIYGGLQADSLYAGKGQPLVTVEEIYLGDCVEVYDITVEEDSSFQAEGVFSHNCSRPNLQQIPREKPFRRCFRVRPGRVLVLADYATIEMRLVAEIAKDLTLMRVFIEGGDVHYATASLVTQKAIASISKDERQQAKAVNFGFIYGMRPEKFTIYALANYGVVIPLPTAEKFHARYFANYAGIKRWHQRVLRDGQRTGISRTLSGRLRYLDPNTNYNEFMNNPVQGSGADALKMSMRNVYQRLQRPVYGGRAYLCHMVHDELIVECDDDPDMIAAVKLDLEQGMTEGMAPFLKQVPIVVEASSGPSWADAK